MVFLGKFGGDIQGRGFCQGKLQQLWCCEDALDRCSAGSRYQLPEREASGLAVDVSRGLWARERRKMLWSLEGVIGRCNMKLNLAEELIRSIGGMWTCPEREDAQERHLPLQSTSSAPVPADTDCASTLWPG